MVGLSATLKDHWTRKGHEDLLNYLTLYDTNDNLKMYIALAGLQHAGVIFGKFCVNIIFDKCFLCNR